jgi:hypothetical protein
LAIVAGGGTHAADPEPVGELHQVSLQIYYNTSTDVAAPQEWLAVLAEAGLDQVKMDRAQGSVEPSVSQSARGWHVVGVLGRNGGLQLPGGVFSVGQRRQLVRHLSKLISPAAGGFGEPGSAVPAPGRAAEDRALRKRLSAAVSEATKDVPLDSVLAAWQSAYGLRLNPAADARPLGAGERNRPVTFELQGMSVGTALAILLGRERLEYRVARSTDRSTPAPLSLEYGPTGTLSDAWPVGYLPKEAERTMAPQLMEFAPVEITRTPLPQVVDALQQRLQLPVYWDVARLEDKKIVPEKVLVNFPNKRTFYRQVLSQVLAQARLKGELRSDEADKPFLWIRPLIP